MKIRARRVAALLMAVTLMSVSVNPVLPSAALAAEGDIAASSETMPTETAEQVPAETQQETTAPVTEAPVTEAPVTEAPVTEASVTEAAATEAPTEAPTEAAAQASSEAVSEAATEASTQASTEAAVQSESFAAIEGLVSDPEQSEIAQSESKEESEEESEEEGKTRTLETSVSKGKLTVKLPKGKGVAKSSTIVIDAARYKDSPDGYKKINKAILGRQRVITGGRFYTIYIQTDNETVKLPEGTKITFENGDGINLKMDPQLQAKCHLYNLSGKSAEEISADITLNKELQITGFQFTTSGKLTSFALIGEENRANDGGAVSRDSVVGSIGSAGKYAAVSTSINGTVEEDSVSDDEGILNSLSGYSVSLANAQSSDDAVVVNLYTDAEGHVITDSSSEQDPMRAVLNEAGHIDISGRMVVLNYVVTNPETSYVSLPHYDVDTTVEGVPAEVNRKHNTEQVGRIVVNVTTIAEGTDGNYTLAPYTGGVGLAKPAYGTCLVPQGTISIEKTLFGAAYAKTVNIGKKIVKETVRAEYSEEEEETETETETETKAETETETETETKAETESETSSESESVMDGTEETETEAAGAAAAVAAAGMALAAAEEDDETADTAQIGDDPTYVKGGLDTKNLTVNVNKTSSSGASLAGATLALYSGSSAVTYTYTESDVEYQVTMPANTLLASCTATEQSWEGWDISKFIKANVTSTTDPVTYVIKETTVPAGHTKAWDFSFTCTASTSGDTTSYTIAKSSTGSLDKSSVSNGSFSDSSPCTLEIVDTAITSGQSINLEVQDSSKTSDNKLDNIPLAIYNSSNELLAEFSSAGTSAIDLSAVAGTVEDPVDETPVTASFRISESATADGYAYVSNTQTCTTLGSTDAEITFTSSFDFTVTKARSSDGVVTEFFGLPKDGVLVFRQVPLASKTFMVKAICSTDSTLLNGIGFKLAYGSTQLTLNTHYTVKYNNADVGSSSTSSSGEVTVQLTEAGAKLLMDQKTTALTISWPAVTGYTIASDTTTLLNLSNSELTASAATVTATLTPWSFYVGSVVYNTSTYVPGTPFKLVAGSNILAAGTGYSQADTKTTSAKLQISLTRTGAEAVRSAGSLTLVSNGDAPTYDNVEYAYKDSSASVTADGQTSLITLTAVTGTGSIIVSKQTKTASGARYYVPDTAGRYFYVRVYTDSTLQNPVTEAQPLLIPYSTDHSGYSSSYSTAAFSGLAAPGTYYLAETDANGTPYTTTMPSGVTSIRFSTDNGVSSTTTNAYQISVAKNQSVNVLAQNIYSTAGLTDGTFQIKLNVVDSNNKPLASNLTASFYVAGGNGTHLKNNKTITLTNETTKTKSDISYKWSGNSIKIMSVLRTLKDASGNSVMSQYNLVDPTTFEVLASGTAMAKYKGRVVTVTSGDKNAQTIEFTLKKVETTKEIAELKLTKAVTYKKTPIRVNGTYYFGIFEDANHKKLLYKKAMSLSNASSMTSTLKINLYKLPSPHTLTLYFAETDKNGKVVSSGSKTGYNISLSQNSITLSPTNATASITLTNDVIDGGVAAANLTDPTSGFAGDSSALAEAQALSNSETTASKPTGDDTPFEPFALATGLSAGIIFLMLILIAAKKKKWFSMK